MKQDSEDEELEVPEMPEMEVKERYKSVEEEIQ